LITAQRVTASAAPTVPYSEDSLFEGGAVQSIINNSREEL
jgi:hypothetical protein